LIKEARQPGLVAAVERFQRTPVTGGDAAQAFGLRQGTLSRRSTKKTGKHGRMKRRQTMWGLA
jgi:hypothetical protein